MSKNKGGKNAKKERSVEPKKAVSDYQAGKKPALKADIFANKKKA